MQYAVAYITNKIVSAQDLDLTLDEKLRIICPSCNHPLTFVRTLKESKFFRHPKRTNEQLLHPEYQCEQRVGGMSTHEVHSHNKIIDQTNLQAFQRHFFRIVTGGEPKPEEVCLEVSRLAFTPKVVKMFTYVEDEYRKYSRSMKLEFPGIMREVAVAQISSDTAERFNFYCDLLRRVSGSGENEAIQRLTIERIADPAHAFLAGLASGWLQEVNHKVKKDEEGRQLLIEYAKMFGSVLRMLEHRDSAPMRYFAYALNSMILVKDGNHRVAFGRDARRSLVGVMAEYVYSQGYGTTKEMGVRPAEEIAKDIFECCKDQGDLVAFRESIGTFFTYTEPPEWYEILKRISTCKPDDSYSGRGGFVYVAFNKTVKEDEVKEVKIGMTKDIKKREDGYRTYSPDGFAFYSVESVIDRHKAENYVHGKLKKFRIDRDGGSEWYALSLKDGAELVRNLCMEFSKQSGYFEHLPALQGKGFGG